MSMLLLNKRKGPIDLKPRKKGEDVYRWAGGTTVTVEDAEGKALLNYKDVVRIVDGKQVAGPAGLVPVPAGTGLAGKATVPAAPAAAATAKK